MGGSSAAGRVALVTGGAGGIGSAIVRALAATGHRVAIGYASRPERAEHLALELEQAGARAMAVPCDVTDRAGVARAFETIEAAWEPVAVLVNNGGIRIVGPLARMEVEDFERVLAVNLTGAFNTIHCALPAMLRARWGRIVNISSPAGHIPMLGSGAYGTSKAALEQLTKVLAVEVARQHITANVVAPGFVRTEMTEEIGPALLEEIMESQAADRAVETREVAALVQFLVSDDAEMISGQVIDVDGGGQLVIRPPRKQST